MSATTIRDFGVPVNSSDSASFARNYPPGFGPGEPWYEPDHLRHRPGDVWQIGGKPYDPEDPGPWRPGPDYVPDTRTGRHRRSELPDLHPVPEFEPIAEFPPAESHRPRWSDRQPEYDRPTARPRRGYRDWREPEPDRNYDPDAALREGAWHRFLAKTNPFYEAHLNGDSLDLRRFERAWWLLRWAIYVLTCCTTAEPRPFGQQAVTSEPTPAPTAVSTAPEPASSLRTSPREVRQQHTQVNDMTFILQWESSFDTGPLMLDGAL